MILSLTVSIACFAAGLCWCIFSGPVSRRLRKDPVLSPVQGLTAGTAAAMLSLYLIGGDGSAGGPVDTFFTAVLSTIRAITGENTVFDTRSLAGDLPAGLLALFNIYTSMLHLLSYALVFGLILSLLKDFFPKLRYRLFSRGPLCILSEINERAILLAEDLHRKDPRTVIVFLAVRESDSESFREWTARARAIRAYCFPDDETALPIPRGCRKERIDFILLEESDTENLRCALQLTEKYRGCRNIRITTAVAESDAMAFVDSAKKDGLSLRLMDEAQITVWQLFDRTPLFLGAKEGRLEILIIGAGRVGMEAIRTACWCGQTALLRPVIHVIDIDPSASERFARLCPELAEGNEDCPVFFHQLDVNTPALTGFLKEHPRIGYVICSIEDEKMSLQAGIEVRRYFHELQPRPADAPPFPIVSVLLRDPYLFALGRDLEFASRADCQYRLSTFGSLKEVYTWENVSRSYLETLAFRFHRHYGGSAEQFEESAYSRRSSMALALHCKYKLWSALPDRQENWSERPSPQLQEAYAAYLRGDDLPAGERAAGAERRLEEMADLEHRRWSAFMRADGWRKASEEQVRSYLPVLGDYRNMLAKLHPCLVPTGDLDRVTALCTELGQPRDFRQSDREMVMALPDVMKDC